MPTQIPPFDRKVAIRMTVRYRGQFVSYAHGALWERTFVNIIWLTRKIGVRTVSNMMASASALPVFRHATAFVTAAGRRTGAEHHHQNIRPLRFAVIAGLFAAPPLAAIAGIGAGMAFGAYLNRDTFADDPGFPAMLVPLGMIAIVASAAAFAGNLIAHE